MKRYKPTTPGRRGMTSVDYSSLTEKKPEKKLTKKLKQKIKFSKMDVLVSTTMKNVAKCDKKCEFNNREL